MTTYSETSTISIAEAEQVVGTVAARAKGRNPNTVVDSDLLNTTAGAEAARTADGAHFISTPGRADPNTGTRAAGIGQMFPAAFLATYRRMYPGTSKTAAEIKAIRTEVLNDPTNALVFMGRYMEILEQELESKSWTASIREPAYRRALIAAAYHLGVGGIHPLVTEASEGGSFNITRFVELYENAARATEKGVASDRVRRLAGIGGSTADSIGKGGAKEAAWRRTDLGPLAKDAQDYIQMGNVVGSAAPPEPPTILPEGLDAPEPQAGLIGNPMRRAIPSPACFEIRLNQQDGQSLPGADGKPLQVKLNVSLQSLRTSSQHIVDRSPTATGFLMTFWGMQPDVLVGRGTTGVFLNHMGLTALMSSQAAPGEFADVLESFSAAPPAVRTALRANKDRAFRVAAQDAFAELLALFKHNGLTRFLPERMLPAEDLKNQQLWSPAAGATGFQMIARAGDIHTRGFVAFKYKGSTYLGYFKSLEFTASATQPYKWDFSFQFKVLRTYTSIFVRR